MATGHGRSRQPGATSWPLGVVLTARAARHEPLPHTVTSCPCGLPSRECQGVRDIVNLLGMVVREAKGAECRLGTPPCSLTRTTLENRLRWILVGDCRWANEIEAGYRRLASLDLGTASLPRVGRAEGTFSEDSDRPAQACPARVGAVTQT